MRAETRWFCYVKREQAPRLRLFCLPHAGGDAVMYSPWREWLPRGIELWPLEPPGRGVRLGEPPYTSVGPLADDLSGALAPWLDLPFAIFGHSLGAKVAFEVARRLESQFGRSPVKLFAAAQAAPHTPSTHEPVHAQPRDQFAISLRRLGTPAGVLDNPELFDIFEPVLRADFAACETYRFEPGPPLVCPITALGGLADPDVSPSGLEGWRLHTAGRFSVRTFPGGHFFVNSARPLVAAAVALELSDSLEEELADVRRREGRHDDLQRGRESRGAVLDLAE